jgi:hypothetical protein
MIKSILLPLNASSPDVIPVKTANHSTLQQTVVLSKLTDYISRLPSHWSHSLVLRLRGERLGPRLHEDDSGLVMST